MSGWNPADKYMEENTYNDFPAINNITMYGALPTDQIPSPSKFKNWISYVYSKIKNSC